MSTLVADCPRCGAKTMTFDVKAEVFRFTEYNWQRWHEVFSVCRACSTPTIFLIGVKDSKYNDTFRQEGSIMNFKGALNNAFEIRRYVSLRDHISIKPPEYLPQEITDIFNEGAACFSIGCNNAAATMFRLCVDMATRPMLPNTDEENKPQPNSKQRRDLGLRLSWLFDNRILPESLRELAKCIREDANDGAHVGNLSKEDTEDLLDFTTILLERLITEPKRLELAEERRNERRAKAS